MKYKLTSATSMAVATILYVTFLIAIIYGYFSNIAGLISMAISNQPLGAMLVARILGIFIPTLGIIMGYF